jgi:hypothetical protein
MVHAAGHHLSCRSGRLRRRAGVVDVIDRVGRSSKDHRRTVFDCYV